MSADRRPRCRPVLQRGLTLIELIMFIVIVGVGVAGILAVISVTSKSSGDPMVRKQSIAMAEAILEEILAKEFPSGGFAETDFSTCPNRALYDDVDDYACFDGAPATAVITGANTLGAVASLPVSFSATVAVTSPTVNGVTMKRIAVTVTDPSGATYGLFGYKADY